MVALLKRNSTLLLTLIVSVLWLVALFGIVADFSVSAVGRRFNELQSLPLNNLGDFLAGVFAPLAFVWFIAAVLMQSVELRHQRKELELTRFEYGENRKVTTLQAHEAKRQAEYLEIQTNILMETYRDAELERSCNATVKLMSARLRQYAHVWNFTVVNHSHEPIVGQINPISVPRGVYSDLTDEMVISKTAMMMRTNRRNLEKMGNAWLLVPESPYDLERVFGTVKQACDILADMPGRHQAQIAVTEYKALGQYLAVIENSIVWPSTIKPAFGLSQELKN